MTLTWRALGSAIIVTAFVLLILEIGWGQREVIPTVKEGFGPAE